MARKPRKPKHLSVDDSIDQLTATLGPIVQIMPKPLFGLLPITFTRSKSQVTVLINEEMANQLVGELTEFLKGRAPNLMRDDN